MSDWNKFRKLVGQALIRYRMISDGDRVLVGLSGGRDSFALMHALAFFQKKAPIRFELVAATFDPGFPEFRIHDIEDYCRRQGWTHRVVSLNVASILSKKNVRSTPCVLCSRLRRGNLYRIAKEERCGKLALGQHLDDIETSFLISLFRGHGLTTMGPNVPANDGALRVIRPLAFVPEVLVKSCARLWDVPCCGTCPYEADLESGDRAEFRRLLDELSRRIPNLRMQMLHSLSNLQAPYLLDPRYVFADPPGAERLPRPQSAPPVEKTSSS